MYLHNLQIFYNNPYIHYLIIFTNNFIKINVSLRQFINQFRNFMTTIIYFFTHHH